MQSTFRRFTTILACALLAVCSSVSGFSIASVSTVRAYGASLCAYLSTKLPDMRSSTFLFALAAVAHAAVGQFAAARAFVLRIIRRVTSSIHTPYLWGAIPV